MMTGIKFDNAISHVGRKRETKNREKGKYAARRYDRTAPGNSVKL